MCQSHWSDLPFAGDNYGDDYLLHWDFGCFDGFVCLVCSRIRPLDYAAESWCVVMSTIDQHMLTAVADDAYHHFYCV